MMNELEKVIDRIAANAEQEPDDFTDPVTGLLCCGQCCTPKQCRVTIFEKERLLPCLCQCEKERREAEDAARKEQERLNRIHRLKANALQDKALFAYTFDRDDGQNPAMKYARRYVEHFAAMKERGQGLFLGRRWNRQDLCRRLYRPRPHRAGRPRAYDELLKDTEQPIRYVQRGQKQISCQLKPFQPVNH